MSLPTDANPTYPYKHKYDRSRRPSVPDFNHSPALKPGTKNQTSARFISPETETPQARPGALPRRGAGGRAPAHALCVEPRRLEVGAETRGVPSSGAGAERTEGNCTVASSFVGRNGWIAGGCAPERDPAAAKRTLLTAHTGDCPYRDNRCYPWPRPWNQP